MENAPDIERIHALVHNLTNPETRAEAMEELGKMRDIPNASELLAIILWHSYGSIAALLQEVVCLYPLLSYTKQIKVQANRTCNALALLQCVAAHNDTRVPFFQCTYWCDQEILNFRSISCPTFSCDCAECVISSSIRLHIIQFLCSYF
jgi:hypothetical protein